MEPYLYTMVELRYVNHAKNSNKFYRGFLDHQTNEVFFHYGKAGGSAEYYGSWTEPKRFETLEAGHEALMAQVRKKAAKGYKPSRSVTITCAKRANASELARQVTRLDPSESRLVIANV